MIKILFHAIISEKNQGFQLTAKNTAGVAPEVNLRKRHILIHQSAYQAAQSGFETWRTRLQKSKTEASMTPQKGIYILHPLKIILT